MPSALSDILAKYRATAQTVSETGTYFEELIRRWFRCEASYADLYSDLWPSTERQALKHGMERE